MCGEGASLRELTQVFCWLVGTSWDDCWAKGKGESSDVGGSDEGISDEGISDEGSSDEGISDEGIGAAGPTFLLPALVDPEVGHPPGSKLFSTPPSRHPDQFIQTIIFDHKR